MFQNTTLHAINTGFKLACKLYTKTQGLSTLLQIDSQTKYINVKQTE